ncbi:hypothetical protein T439DRAFT_322707 [Meredithblackwellia eburnea MCA 4105]
MANRYTRLATSVHGHSHTPSISINKHPSWLIRPTTRRIQLCAQLAILSIVLLLAAALVSDHHKLAQNIHQWNTWRWTWGWNPLDTPTTIPPYSQPDLRSLDQRCGDDCKFILPLSIGEQESRAQVHLYQLAVFALGLDRILVLPGSRHSKFSVCFSRPFDFFYDPHTLSRLGFPTVSKREYEQWIKRRKGRALTITSQTIVVQNPSWHEKPVNRQSPYVWSPSESKIGDYPQKKPHCLAADLDFSHYRPVSFYGTGTGVDQVPNTPHFLSEVFQSLEKGGLGYVGPEPQNGTPPPQADVLSFSLAGQHPDFRPPELSALRPHIPLARPFEIYTYSTQLVAFADTIAAKLSPFVAVQWRTEQIPAENLAPCGRSLIAMLESEKLKHPQLTSVYVCTDYPLEGLRNVTLAKGPGGGAAHSSSYRISDEVHDAMRTFVKDWERKEDELPKMTSWDEEEDDLLSIPADKGADRLRKQGKLRDVDLSLLGMMDKMIATRAELFIAGAEHECGKLSSYMKAIADARDEVVEQMGEDQLAKVQGVKGQVWNSKYYFHLPQSSSV